jgi:DnaD/phage-associated family protein
MTNSKTSQCGIYELPKRIIETETGYNRETVDKLLKRFEEYEKIIYCEKTKEIMILNWLKFNFINSAKVKSCMTKELLEVKNKDFLKKLLELVIEYKLAIDTLWIPYQYPIDTLGIDYGEEEEKEEEREEEKEEKEREEEEEKKAKQEVSATVVKPTFKDVISVFNNNIHLMTSIEREGLIDWSNKVQPGVIIKAIEQAVVYNKRSFGYINSILLSWFSKNITTIEGVEAEIREWMDKQNKSKTNPKQSIKGNFNNYEQRTYEEAGGINKIAEKLQEKQLSDVQRIDNLSEFLKNQREAL